MTEQKPKKVKKPKPPFTGMTPIYERLLFGTEELPYGGVYWLHMLRAEQLGRLYYSPNSVKHVQELLRELVDHHYLQADWPPTKKTRSKYIYMLGEEGIALAKDNDYDVSASLRTCREVGKSYTHILHLLELNDVLISAMLLGKQVPLYYLERLIHDRELKRHPCDVTWRGKRLQVIPDAFLTMISIMPDGSKRRAPILLEHDRGSEFGEGFRKKVRGLIALLKTEAYKARFGVNSVTIAFTTFKGEKRRDRMREVVRQELGGDLKTLGYCFVFTAQPQPPEPTHIWLKKCWYMPSMDSKPIAILGGE